MISLKILVSDCREKCSYFNFDHLEFYVYYFFLKIIYLNERNLFNMLEDSIDKTFWVGKRFNKNLFGHIFLGQTHKFFFIQIVLKNRE